MSTYFEADRTNIHTEPRPNAFLSILGSSQPTTKYKAIQGPADDVYRKNRKKGVKWSDLIGRPFFQFLLGMTVFSSPTLPPPWYGIRTSHYGIVRIVDGMPLQ